MDSSILMRRSAVVLLTIILCAPAACSNAKPSNREIEDAFRASMGGPAAKDMELETFEKLDGLAKTEEGVQQYEAKFSAVVRFTSSVQYSTGGGMLGMGVGSLTAQPMQKDAEGSLTGFFYAANGLSVARAGDRLRIEGGMVFNKYESGWKVARMMYRAVLDSAAREVGLVAAETRGSARQSGEVREPAPRSIGRFGVSDDWSAADREAARVINADYMNLSTAQSAYFADSLHYIGGSSITRDHPLVVGRWLLFAPRSAAEFSIRLGRDHRGEESWSATATLRDPPIQCIVTSHLDSLPPGASQGETWCTRGIK